VHLRPGEQVSGTVVFVILHRQKANKVFGKRFSHNCSQIHRSSSSDKIQGRRVIFIGLIEVFRRH
jgi:hypothetical protein